MRYFHQGWFRQRFGQQFQFLRQQFLQDEALPFGDVLSESIVARALSNNAVQWFDRIYTPLVTLPSEIVHAITTEIERSNVEDDIIQRLKADHKLRKRFCRQTTEDGLIDALNSQLALSSDQEEKLVTVLKDEWDDSWTNQAMQLVMSQTTAATGLLPEKRILPLLTEQEVFS